MKLLPRAKPTGRTVCTICACVIEPALQDKHLAVCPVKQTGKPTGVSG